MARARPSASFLPAIKCSNCAVEVEVSMMGNHICSTLTQAEQPLRHPGDSNSSDRVPRAPSQRDRSFSRPGPPLRVDSSVANRLYLRPNELTPASSETVSPIGGPYGRKSPSHLPQRNLTVHLTQAPPSPEYTNLDCAFPPFPMTKSRSATPIQKTMTSNSQTESGYVREHAEPYNQSRPSSPSSRRHSRARSVTSSRSRNRSGTVGNRPEMAPRPSTAHGARKASLVSIAGGPRTGWEEQPPLPPTASVNAAHSTASNVQTSGFLGLGRDASEGGISANQAGRARPVSPSRSQTFPMHNNERRSGNGPNSFIGRRPSQPAPMLSAGRQDPGSTSGSSNSFQTSKLTFRPYNPQNQNSSSQTKPESHPSRTARRNSNRSLTGNRPFPVRSASRSDIRVDVNSLIRPPLPTESPAGSPEAGNKTQLPSETTKSVPFETSVAQPSISRSSPPPEKQTLAKEVSKTNHGSDAAHVPLPDLTFPLQPPAHSIQPESPTDPLCQQGRLSPIPRAAMTRSPFSTISSSSGSSGTSYPNQSIRGSPSRRGTVGGSRGRCRGCLQPILPGQKSISSKDGRLTGRYHKDCFACHSCRGRFETADFYVHDDHPFCAEHYHALNGSLCNGCGKGVEGQYLESTNKHTQTAEKFHPQCLTCSTCRISLQNDYYEWMGKVYCERDARRAAGLQNRSPSDAFSSPSPILSPGSNLSNNATSLGRPSGLPSGPRAGFRAPGTGQAPGTGNGFLSPFPPNSGARAPTSGGRFPERRTTKLMMMSSS